ncbi:hypothetical protein PRZ48_003998 [Zasmidium cellare]|uniref:Ketoreductase domain-containing protein n=1 Tax=Zasmidium cellare TaxID=395010 RepID=A0ABR0EYZ3_ZASCE|nr:hypothetical protein PRZ48_003998 [Zasmidium cellare]
MPIPKLSYTHTTHTTTYPTIYPTQSHLTTNTKVVLITGASGGIGRATAASFAASKPKALILLGRREDALVETEALVREREPAVVVKTFSADLCDAPTVRAVMENVVSEFGSIDVLVHCAGVLAPVTPLLDADPTTFLDGYKTTILGTLITAQAALLANPSSHPLTFLNLTTAAILSPPFPGMGAYISSKTAAVKLLQSFAAENGNVRIRHVHPGFLETEMARTLEGSGVKLPFAYDDVSLPADFLVWIASDEAGFLRDRIVFAAWDVEELKGREGEISGGTGELGLGLRGFPRYVNDQLVG